MPPSCVGAIMHSSSRTGSGMSKWFAAELGDRPVAQSPASTAAGRRCRAACASVGVEELDRLVDRRARLDLVGDARLLARHARELVDAPLVGLVEVDVGAEEAPRVQGVGLAAHGVVCSMAAGSELVARNSASVA